MFGSRLFLSALLASAFGLPMPGIDDGRTQAPSSGEGRTATSPAVMARIQLILSARGLQIETMRGRGEAGASAPFASPLSEGTYVIECDRISIGAAPTDTQARQFRCSGDVVIRSNRFTAQADCMVKNADQVVLTGDGKPVHFEGQPSKEVKLFVSMAASQVTLDLAASRSLKIIPL